jgi:hypothetical protein
MGIVKDFTLSRNGLKLALFIEVDEEKGFNVILLPILRHKSLIK